MSASLENCLSRTQIAYFSMEIALRNEMHTYSGGLGVLAGDTVRSCADLEIPVVLVTLASRQGYLHQEIDARGRQVEHPDPWELRDWATALDVKISIELEGRSVWVRPWLYGHTCPLGHWIPVLLLDTDLPENTAEDRRITDVLYGGDELYRLKQEAVLGIGGVRTLQALGFTIHTYHMNEGHAALLTIELLKRHRRPAGVLDPGEPVYENEHVVESCIFTTHTPVEAGHDQFAYSLIANVLGSYIELDELRRYAGTERCNMTRLALNLSGFVNGVAPRHAETTRRMFPGYQIRAISNGIHPATWTHPAVARLYDRHFPKWAHEPDSLISADQVPDSEISAAHASAKRDLLDLVKARTGVILDEGKPIVGFGRRMTSYKRPSLIFGDRARLRRLNASFPFQMVFSGKAHPRDRLGKELIETITREIAELGGELPMAYLPNYDMQCAASLVSGVDIWLNTPLPPLEASGTSGMKAALNGVLNVSVLDGWWLDAAVEDVTGWSIGNHDPEDEETHETALYDVLEKKVLPLYYNDRARWIWMMKQSISKIAPRFNSQDMMRRYAAEAYLR